MHSDSYDYWSGVISLDLIELILRMPCSVSNQDNIDIPCDFAGRLSLLPPRRTNERISENPIHLPNEQYMEK